MSRAQVERLLDLLNWGWDGALSRLLDEAVLAEEGAW
jgi:hypothetical protein